MRTYFDTSVLLKSYLPEPGTAEVLTLLRQQAPPFPLSHLLELELRTAIRLKHGRGEVSAAEMRGTLQAIESDFAAGVLARPDYDLAEVFRRAEAISAKIAAATLTRSADLWHVAAALEAGCDVFVSFDERQREAAARCGLKVLPAKLAANKERKAK